jgi:hypothetical protein
MKNLLVYYLFILSPFALMLWMIFSGHALAFVITLLLYSTIYRGVTDYFRLKARGYIGLELLRLLVPFRGRRRFFRDLYFR